MAVATPLIINPGQNVWLKPWGQADQPLPKNEDCFTDDDDTVEFHPYPRSVQVDDVMIVYAVEWGNLLAVTRVASQPYPVPEKELERDRWRKRWPWRIDVRVLCPRLGHKWSENELFLSELCDTFLSKYRNKGITPWGGTSLCAVQRGYMRLRPEFGRFLIAVIQKRISRTHPV